MPTRSASPATESTPVTESNPATESGRTAFDPAAEFDRQVRTLLDLGYPALTGLSSDAFEAAVVPLRRVAIGRTPASSASPGPERVPFVLVIAPELVSADRTMQLTRLGHRPGFVDYEPDDLARFVPNVDLGVPTGHAYLLLDVERHGDTLGSTPDEAMTAITERRRTPITVEEGIAFLTHVPAALERNHCFHTAGSCCGDQRVPALWISKNAPKLGWCWARNRHTWLGVASCAGRAGLD